MATILCPTRGGQASFPNQDRAITLAKQRQAQLVFLYVSNVSFLDRLASPVLVDVETELEQMGEFVLAMAQERAANADVVATGVVRRGSFREALTTAIEEQEAEIVVLGTPSGESALTTTEFLNEMAQELMATHQVEVIMVLDGEIVNTIRP